MSMTLRPITLRAANAFVTSVHRHHPGVRGCLWCLSCWNGDRLCGVLICGRPIARAFDDGLTCEVTRCCTDGTRNACSFLYGAAARAARATGYRRILTYTLTSESGASLRGAGWLCVSTTRAHSWDHSGRHRPNAMLPCPKHLWLLPLSTG